MSNAWEGKLELLCLYKSSNGNTSVPSSYSSKDGVSLGKWADIPQLSKSTVYDSN